MDQKVFYCLATCVLTLLQCGCSRQSEEWDRAVKTDTPAGYQYYLKRYPEGDKAKLAEARSAALIEHRQWLAVSRIPSETGLNAFLRDNPSSIWAPLAQHIVETLSAPDASEPEPQSVDQQSSDHEAEPIPDAVQSQEPKPVAAPRPATPKATRVQLGAFKTRSAAMAALDSAKATSSALRASEPQIDVISVKGQSLYRVRTGVPSEEQAKKACAELSRVGSTCLIVKKQP